MRSLLLILFFTLNAQAYQYKGTGLSYEPRAYLTEIVDHRLLIAEAETPLFQVGDNLPVYSATGGGQPVAFVQVIKIEGEIPQRLFCQLLEHSRWSLVRPGDYLQKIDLSKVSESYLGGTELLVRSSSRKISTRYKPLVYQGLSIGETAEVLMPDENLITFLGYYSYGFKNGWMATTIVPGYFFGLYNLNIKKQFLNSENHVLSWQLKNYFNQNTQSTRNAFEFYWDSINAGNQIAHTVLTVNLAPFGIRKDELLNIITSTSLQSEYEFILDNWDRVLVGPKYNFDLKAVGGHLSYLAIWDSFNLSLTLSTVDFSSIKFDPEKGYLFSFDLFWRY